MKKIIASIVTAAFLLKGSAMAATAPKTAAAHSTKAVAHKSVKSTAKVAAKKASAKKAIKKMARKVAKKSVKTAKKAHKAKKSAKIKK